MTGRKLILRRSALRREEIKSIKKDPKKENKMKETGTINLLIDKLRIINNSATKTGASSAAADAIMKIINDHVGDNLNVLKNVPFLGDMQPIVFTGIIFTVIHFGGENIPYGEKLETVCSRTFCFKLTEKYSQLVSNAPKILEKIYNELKSKNLLN
jgi:hypothetical protein